MYFRLCLVDVFSCFFFSLSYPEKKFENLSLISIWHFGLIVFFFGCDVFAVEYAYADSMKTGNGVRISTLQRSRVQGFGNWMRNA